MPRSSAAAADGNPRIPWPSTSMAVTTVKVDGMTCGACTSAVEGAFQGVDGVEDVSVSLVLGRAVVRHDPTLFPAEKIAESIEGRGFDATVLSTEGVSSSRADDTGTAAKQTTDLSVTTLAVEGMTCGACTSAVETGLRDVPGVISVEVSLLSERAVVEHDASIISPAQVAEVIEDRGFGARVLDTKASTSGSTTSSNDQDSRRQSRSMATTVAIEGMTCGACTASVENAFRGADGLIQFNISLLAERAIIVHDPAVLTTQRIISMIEDAGFDAAIVSSQAQEQSSHTITSVILNLHGLQDAQSATALEATLLQKPGIRSASISMAASRLSVSFDTSIIGIRTVVEAIEAAGYNALIADTDDNNAQLESLAKTKEIQQWARAFRISLSFAIPVFIINMLIPMYLPAIDFGNLKLLPGLYLGDLICLVLTIPVQFGIGKRFYASGLKSLKHRSPTMDVLVMLGTSAAFFYSCFTMIVAIFREPHLRPSTVFDTSTMLITFITLGRWLENRAKGQTSAALSRLMSLAPSMTMIYDDPIAAEKQAEVWSSRELAGQKDPGAASSMDGSAGQKIIPTELIQVGDVVVLRPGDKVSADGVVIRGESYVDESMITGEALPIHKKKGDSVIAGTVNGTGSIDFKVTRAGKDTQLSQIVKLVQHAQTNRAPIQRMADIVAGYFVPAIITLGLITFFGWMFLSHLLPDPPKIFVSERGGGKVMVCLKLCISVIVFACPCALGLSTPTAVMVGTGVGAEHGILIKGGAILEAATKVNHVVFDKTGTLTFGKMSVDTVKLESYWTTSESRRQLWWLIVGLAEMSSEHPIGKTIISAARTELGHFEEQGLPGVLGDFEACLGKGISAVVEPAAPGSERIRYRVLVGNAAFLQSRNITLPLQADPELQGSDDARRSRRKLDSSTGLTQIHVAIDEQYTGTISLRDTIKPTAIAAVAALHRMGISTSMVTGDTYSTAISIAEAVGIPPSAVHASVSPGDKRAIISSLQEPSRGDRVAMVGDGINDSPALATASVGIALASGTDVAMEAADIVLMRPDDLLSIPASLSLSRAVFNRIKINLMWACVYNVIGLPFAMGLFLPFGGFMLPPMAAGAAMAASSVSVVVSSLLLKFWKRPRWMTVEGLQRELELGYIVADYDGGGGDVRRARGWGWRRGRHSRKISWWKAPTLSSSSSSSLPTSSMTDTLFARMKDTATGLVSALTTGRFRAAAAAARRRDEGYVPLQTIETAQV